MHMGSKQGAATLTLMVAVFATVSFHAGCGDDGTDPEVKPSVIISGSHSLKVGKTLSLSASTSGGSDTTYSWSSATESVATVDSSGVVTGVAAGETTITSTGKDTGAVGTHAVVVVSASADAVQVAISGNHSAMIGKTLKLGASTLNGKDTTYTWSSSKETVATVDSSGLVTGVAAGETTITATGGTTKAAGKHAVVVIASSSASAMISIKGAHALLVGKTSTLAASTSGGTDTSYTWKSDKLTVATVDAKGVVTGLTQGVATITATGTDSKAVGSFGLVVAHAIPNSVAWLASAHAKKTAEAFSHWDKDTPAEVPTSCAKCHSSTGYRDFLGDDGSTKEKVDKAVKVGEVVDCSACHNKTADKLAQVTFPSAITVKNLGPEARCMTCHQGRGSSVSVEKKITDAKVATDDTVSTALSFQNIHYFPAGATLMAGRVKGGAQYKGKFYDWRFRHVPTHDTCVDCHDQHSLQVKITECATCHTGVKTKADLKKIRMISSMGVDYDGDGNLTEGLYDEIEGLKVKLYQALQAYGANVAKSKICYDTGSYPYFFIDTDGDGKCSATEAVSANKYVSWTARMVRAAYNYQMSLKDPGNFAHNGKYIIQLLYDSVTDLNTKLTTKVDMTKAKRNDPGHFNGAGEAARHWDEDASVSASCSKCHGGSEGLNFYLKYGVGKAVLEQDNGLDCATCHTKFSGKFDLVTVASATFPSGKVITSKTNSNNLCATCHSGREAMATIQKRITDKKFGFRNVHYLPSAAVKNGADAAVGWQYSGKTYAKAFVHKAGDNCTFCHNAKKSNHSFLVSDVFKGTCDGCHSPATKATDIRGSAHKLDYDGDGSTTESLKAEIEGLSKALLVAIQAKVAATSKICYTSASYPYWFIDANGNGVCDTTETTTAGRYAKWTGQLMMAAHNYQISQKEHGAWAHNFDYMAQLLIDAIADMGGDVTKLKRP